MQKTMLASFPRLARRTFIPLLLLLWAILFPAPSCSAGSTTWIGANGNWNTSVNWVWSNYPSDGEDVYLVDTIIAGSKFVNYVNPGYDPVLNNLYIESLSGIETTLLQARDALTTTNTWVGITGGGRGAFHQSGGTHTVKPDENAYNTGKLVLGRDAGSVGEYELTGGTLIADREFIGSDGVGTFIQDGGTHRVERYLSLNNGSNGSNEYHLKAGSLVAADVEIGSRNAATFTQEGGTHEVENMTLGLNSGSEGVYNLSGGEVVAETSYVGYWGKGSFSQSGGTNSVTRLYLGMEFGGNGAYRLSDGTLTADTEIIGSDGGTGTFTQEGGTHGSRVLHLGAYSRNSRGAYNLNNGQLTATHEYIGSYDGTGNFVQNGGTHHVNRLYLGYNAAIFSSTESKGTYTLNNGKLTAERVNIGLDGTGIFIQNGGEHVVNGDLRLGSNKYSYGSYTLNNGSLTAGNEDIGLYGTGSFVQEGGTHRINGDLTLGSYTGGRGYYTLKNGTLTAHSVRNISAHTFDFLGGTLEVINIAGDLTNTGGTLAPGASPGLLTVNGDYTQSAGGLLEIELGGLLRGTEYDVLDVNGNLTLDGALNVVWFEDLGFDPSSLLAGTAFDILDWNILMGVFDEIFLPGLEDGLFWDLSDLYTDGTIHVTSGTEPVPVPGTMLLLVSGLIGLAGAGRKRGTHQ